MISELDKKKAVYGAVQRLLGRVSDIYPYTDKDFGFENNPYCPKVFKLVIGLRPNMLVFEEDYTNFKPELGDYLLEESWRLLCQ